MVNLTELIPSKDVREHMEKKGRVLTDFEKATLIYNNSGMSFSEKAAHLKKLMEINTVNSMEAISVSSETKKVLNEKFNVKVSE